MARDRACLAGGLAGDPSRRALVARPCRGGVDEIGHIDLYSSFPSAVQIAAGELGLAIDDPARPLTVTGGLTFAGGPGNNYAAHSIAALVHRLREDPDGYGLATAIGWYLTKHAAGLYSARPPDRPFASIDAHPVPQPVRRSLSHHRGPATLEAYTITFERDGTPDAAIISAVTPDGERTLIRSADTELIELLSTDGAIGRRVMIDGHRVS